MKWLKRTLSRSPAVHRLCVHWMHRWFEFNENRLRKHLADVSQRIESPVFVKVGANDGITGDPCGDIFLTQKH